MQLYTQGIILKLKFTDHLLCIAAFKLHIVLPVNCILINKLVLKCIFLCQIELC